MPVISAIVPNIIWCRPWRRAGPVFWPSFWCWIGTNYWPAHTALGTGGYCCLEK